MPPVDAEIRVQREHLAIRVQLAQAHERGIGGELILNCRTSPPP